MRRLAIPFVLAAIVAVVAVVVTTVVTSDIYIHEFQHCVTTLLVNSGRTG